MQRTSNNTYSAGSGTGKTGITGISKKTKRITVQHACECCRDRKRRCDGVKPVCGVCIAHAERTKTPVKCIYISRPGNRLDRQSSSHSMSRYHLPMSSSSIPNYTGADSANQLQLQMRDEAPFHMSTGSINSPHLGSIASPAITPNPVEMDIQHDYFFSTANPCFYPNQYAAHPADSTSSPYLQLQATSSSVDGPASAAIITPDLSSSQEFYGGDIDGLIASFHSASSSRRSSIIDGYSTLLISPAMSNGIITPMTSANPTKATSFDEELLSFIMQSPQVTYENCDTRSL